MFIKINIRCKFNDEAIEIITSRPSDCSHVINILDGSDQVIAWNMGEHKPEEFGWAKSTSWYKWRERLYDQN